VQHSIVVYCISITNSDHLVISLTSSGPSSWAYEWRARRLVGTRRVAHCSASLTIRCRADGPDDGWSGRTDPSCGPSAHRLLVRPSQCAHCTVTDRWSIAGLGTLADNYRLNYCTHTWIMPHPLHFTYINSWFQHLACISLEGKTTVSELHLYSLYSRKRRPAASTASRQWASSHCSCLTSASAGLSGMRITRQL